jgi:PilZ domain.
MHIIIVTIGIIAAGLIMLYVMGPGKKMKDFIRFIIEGADKGFSFPSLCLLWRTGSYAGLHDKTRLFWSVPALDQCIKFILQKLEPPVDDRFRIKMQAFLNDLYAYRTKIELEVVQKKRSLNSTHEIYLGQLCVVIIPNEATANGKVLINTKESLTLDILEIHSQSDKKIDWKGKNVKMFFWREGDAGYIFSSVVIDIKTEGGSTKLRLKHSDKIIRTQKRKSVRAECKFEAAVFPLRQDQDYDAEYQQSGGTICTVHDISEDGALFLVKGKAIRGVKMKLQFKINNAPVVMCGKIVRCVYNAIKNTSKVHFQSEFLTEQMKNTILSYVYNISPESDNEFMSTLLSEYEKEEQPVTENEVL